MSEKHKEFFRKARKRTGLKAAAALTGMFATQAFFGSPITIETQQPQPDMKPEKIVHVDPGLLGLNLIFGVAALGMGGLSLYAHRQLKKLEAASPGPG